MWSSTQLHESFQQPPKDLAAFTSLRSLHHTGDQAPLYKLSGDSGKLLQKKTRTGRRIAMKISEEKVVKV